MEPGSKVEALIVGISGEHIFLDVGGKSEGVLQAAELRHDAGEITAQVGDRLNVFFLAQRGGAMQFTTRLGGSQAGSRELEEAFQAGIPVSGKVTGEEEIWSHTDLWDFQANVDGARVAWEGLRPILKKRDAALDSQIQLRFAELAKLLDQHKRGDGFVTYDTLTKAQVKALSDAVNALSEPLSKVTAAVV